jgi:serine/threonine protein kinase
VYPLYWDEVLIDAPGSNLTAGSACLTDFGESFQILTPPTELGIPQSYCSPEQVFEQKIGRECDLWALGCTLFEIRTRRKLFGTFDNDMDDHLCTVATILGKYPEPWWSETWEMRCNYFENDAD